MWNTWEEFTTLRKKVLSGAFFEKINEMCINKDLSCQFEYLYPKKTFDIIILKSTWHDINNIGNNIKHFIYLAVPVDQCCYTRDNESMVDIDKAGGFLNKKDKLSDITLVQVRILRLIFEATTAVVNETLPKSVFSIALDNQDKCIYCSYAQAGNRYYTIKNILR